MTPPPMMLNGFLSNFSLNNIGNTVSVLNVMSQLKYRIDQIRVPGISLISVDNQRYGVGPTQKMPYSSQFNEISISMTSDGFGDIWQFWYNWVRGIHQFTGTTSSLIGVGTSLPSYEVEYKDNYSTTIEIVICDLYGVPTIKIDLFEAFPTAIREIPLSWGDSGNLLHLNIGISFTDFTIVGANYESPYTITNSFNDAPSIMNGAYLNNTLYDLINRGVVPTTAVPPGVQQQNSGGGYIVERVTV